MTVQSSGATYQDILKLSLEQEGYTGTLDDMLYSKLKAITSEEGTVQDLMMKYLASIGFDSGAVQDRLKNYLEFFGYTGTNPDMLLTAVKSGVFLDAPVFSFDLYLDYNRQLYTASSTTGQALLSFSPLHTFTRASDKTYFDQNGDLQVAGPNVPVFDYDPVKQKFALSIHEARTNLFLNSDTPETQSITLTAAAHTVSFYGTGEIVLSGAATGTLTGTGASERVTLTFTPTAGSVTFTLTGDVQYPQVELGGFVTPYIISAGTVTLRAADVLSITNINTSDWWNPNEGTLVVEFKYQPKIGGFAYILAIRGVDNQNLFGLYQIGTGVIRLLGIKNNVVSVVNLIAAPVANTVYKIAFRFDDIGNVAASVNGLNPIETSAFNVGTGLVQIDIGHLTGGTGTQLNGSVYKIQYEKQSLSNAELIAKSTL